MKWTRQMAASAAALLLTASAASAATVQVTLTGDTENINDQTGVFGAPGGRITDEAFTETFTINTAKGNLSDTSNPPNYSIYLHGGPGEFFPSSNPISASLTIAGKTFSVDGTSSFVDLTQSGSYFDYNISSNDQTFTPDYQYLKNQVIAADLYSFISTPGVGLPTSLTQGVSLPISGSALSAVDSFTDASFDAQGDILVYSLGTLNPTEVTITETAVPEPASWALMVAGFGLVGAATRSARRRARRGVNGVA